jgi:hypothetical protein
MLNHIRCTADLSRSTVNFNSVFLHECAVERCKFAYRVCLEEDCDAVGD